MALLVVLAMVAAACTQTEADTTTTDAPAEPAADTTTSVVRNSPEAKAMIDAAMGGTQAVQDFAIYFDLVLMPEDGGLESFYDEVRDQAMVGSGQAVELVDGYTLAPVDSLRGAVTDPDGVVLDTISLDFALLGSSPALIEESLQTLSDVFETAGEPGLIDALTASGNGEATLLVQIATADYTQRRTHVGPGDLAVIDLAFVDAISPGDRLASVHLFGQTLPGDPAAEAGLSALELFTYRWDLGLVAMLGDELGVTVVVDDTASIAAGPTVRVEPEGRLVSLDTGETSFPLRHKAPAQPLHLGDPPVANVLPVVVVTNASGSEGKNDGLGKFFTPFLKPLQLVSEGVEGYRHGQELIRRTMARASRDRATDRQAYPIPDSGGCLKSISFEDDHRWYVGYQVDPSNPETAANDVAASVDMKGTNRLCRLVGPADPDSMASALGLLYAQFFCHAKAANLKQANDPAIVAANSFSGLAKICDPLQELPRPDRDFPRTAGMFGDVHFTTFDQLIVQNQAAGEFLVFDNEVATVQVRTEPWKDSDSVSVATAVAARMGDHTVSIHLDTETLVGETYLDGGLAETERGESVAIGGAALSWSGFSWMVVWPDGTELKVFPDTTGLVVFVSSESESVGMFGGDGDGIAENDRVTRSGVVMSTDRSQPMSWDEHYDVYVDSWRITQEESLFYYGPGESTGTYTIEGFPASYWEVSDLAPVVRDEAEAACVGGGITRADILEACILDVSLTDDLAFVYPAYLVEISIPPQAAPLGGSVEGPSLPGSEDMLVVGDFTFEFGADHRFIEGARDPVCRFDGPFSLEARTRFTAEDGAEIQFQFEYWQADRTHDGREALHLFTRENGTYIVWAVINPTAVPGASLTAGSIETVSLVDDTITITGTAYLNEPMDPDFYNVDEALPAGAPFLPFTLRVTCHSS